MPENARNVAVGQRIVAWRLRRGLSQAAVSRRVGLNQSYLSRLEAGKIQPNIRTIQRIAAALRIALPELLGPSPPARTGKPCPVSRGGQCLMDLVDAAGEFGQGKGPERYSPRQLRLIRKFTTLVGEDDRKLLTALEVLVGRMSEGKTEERKPRKKKKTRAGRRLPR